MVHRDIKPANIMYDEEKGEIKVTDFGIARITDSSKTKTGMVLGTPSYMSPEQLSGKKVDGRSDLFSLGVTMYQLLAGQLPFQADSMATLMFKIANEPARRVTVIQGRIAGGRDTGSWRRLCRKIPNSAISGAPSSPRTCAPAPCNWPVTKKGRRA